MQTVYQKDGRSMSKELKPEMWETVIHFLEQIGCEDIEDVSWKFVSDGAVEQITIKFEHPIYLTNSKGEDSG